VVPAERCGTEKVKGELPVARKLQKQQRQIPTILLVAVLLLFSFCMLKSFRKTVHHHAIRRDPLHQYSDVSEKTVTSIRQASGILLHNNQIGRTPIIQPQIFLPTVNEDGTTEKKREAASHEIPSSNEEIRVTDQIAPNIRNTVPNTDRIAFRYWHEDELISNQKSCRQPHWAFFHFPTCNAFHEMPLEREYFEASQGRQGSGVTELDSYYINSGYYRDVWVVAGSASLGRLILKTSKFEFDINYKTLHQVHREANVMERLSSNPSIVDIYGHCGGSVAAEAISYEVERYVVPGSGYVNPGLGADQPADLSPQSDFTPSEKFRMALAMAESIAALHGYHDGVIVHDDIQLRQWLQTKDGILKLGDFNRAYVLDWNDSTQAYCSYNNGQAFGNNRSPEEYQAGELDEAIDVYSFGNCLYSLLTGLWVFYENEDDAIVQEKVLTGKRPMIDIRYRNRSLEEKILVEVIEGCWQPDPKKRLDIFQVVRRLRENSQSL
jgi:hypothetical protein